jgi:transposase
VVGKNPRTVADWLTWYRQGGVAEVLRHRNGGHGGKGSRLTPAQTQELVAAASAGEVRCVQDGRRWAQEHCQVQYTYEGMRHMFGRLGLRKKVPRPRNPKAREEEQTAWKKGG